MKKQLTQEEMVTALTAAISRADRELDLILEPMDHRTSEWSLTICKRVRNILRRALIKVQAGEAPAPTQSARSAGGRGKEMTDARN